jgi:hypothetical protein
MDKISFIPAAQKGVSGYVANDNAQSVYKKYAIGIGVIGFIYLGMLIFVYWNSLVRKEIMIKKDLAELDITSQSIYPAQNIEQAIFNVSDVISKDYNIIQSIEAIEQVYQSNLVMSSFSYAKESKLLTISATISDFESVVAQVEAISKVSMVAKIDFSNLSVDSNNNQVSFDMIINLK